ncbi:MAG: hypothetical protein HYS40_08305 [Gemmatimonadetes bacterium]|nr:hypothetical protein [Gemmatimonadota bacterium]
MGRSSALSLAALAALCGLPASPAAGQWVPPQPPCDVKVGHFRVNSAVVNLKTAAEKPTLRDRMLSQTFDVLTRAIIGDKQDQNAGAWYYLGRYYVEVKDAAGADSAFARAQALAPRCAADIAGHRMTLAADQQTEGLRTWQEGKLDSAVTLLRLAAQLVPTNPKPLFSIGQLFASRDHLDSAVVYLRRGADAAARDTSFAEQRKDALGSIARQYLRRSQGDPAVQQWVRTRFSRDSLERVIATDSSVLGRMQASAASRRARGTRLAPADQQVFSRDSSARSQSLGQGQAARSGLAARAAADSAAAQLAVAPAIQAFRDYLGAYPDDVESVSPLATLYAQSGRTGEAAATFDALYAADRDPGVLVDAGQRILRAYLLTAGTTVLSRGLDRNPYNRDGLFDLANAYRVLRDSTRMLAAVRRLAELDPLNRDVLRLVATAWEMRGRADSAKRYNAQADSILQVDITVAGFGPDTSGYTLTAIASNQGRVTSAPLKLIFEFFDVRGALQGSRSVEIPAIPPFSTRQLEVHVSGTDLRGWRYRPS